MNTQLKITIIIVAVLAIGGIIVGLPQLPQMKMIRPVESKLPTAELLDQNGTQVNFASDIVGDRIIALNLIYTDCSTACPVVSAIFEKLQSQLGEKLQQNVRMVTLSINPIRDTPEKLKAYAEHFHAQPEWRWLTGDKTQVDSLLKALGGYSADYSNHTPIILIGDPTRSGWTRFDGFTSPETLAAKIDELRLARHEKF
jgi:protein SCO1